MRSRMIAAMPLAHAGKSHPAIATSMTTTSMVIAVLTAQATRASRRYARSSFAEVEARSEIVKDSPAGGPVSHLNRPQRRVQPLQRGPRVRLEPGRLHGQATTALRSEPVVAP